MKNLLFFITILSSSTAFADNLNSHQLKDVQLVIALFKKKISQRFQIILFIP
ncbi:hypothetical protein ACBE110449_15045 [Acinetobacter bereziniae]|uniref:Uncharacterized protein n=1 Tax=Acinetobacter bereziniae NIPH 3 TaxID=1217651 RepID=N8YU78_ACIBZ|nr:hypothetical protein F963_00904 [Acinetobacter bereziniae NIPH 3]